MRESLPLIVTVFITIFQIHVGMKFSFQMRPVTMQCLAEFMADKTLSIITVNANSKDIRARLFDPNGSAVFNKENTNSIKLTYTATESGNHQLCIDNYGNKQTIVNFEFLSGIAAKDYTELAKRDNLQPIEVDLQKLEDMMTQIMHSFSSIMSSEKKNLSLGDSLSTKVIIFSIGTIIIMSIIGFSEVAYLKRYWQQRKLI